MLQLVPYKPPDKKIKNPNFFPVNCSNLEEVIATIRAELSGQICTARLSPGLNQIFVQDKVLDVLPITGPEHGPQTVGIIIRTQRVTCRISFTGSDNGAKIRISDGTVIMMEENDNGLWTFVKDLNQPTKAGP